jgi:diguanylate cyclase (GGDEF)-like protein
MTASPLCARFGIDAAAIRARRAFLGFTPADEEHLGRIHDIIRVHVDSIIAEFYAHLMQFRELAMYLAEPQQLARLQQTQRQYLLSLGRDADRPAYFEDRLRIGMTHERVGLQQRWYLGAYVKLFELIQHRLTAHLAAQPDLLVGALAALHKIFTLDALLAVETYYQATTQRLQQTLDQLTQAQEMLEHLSRTDGLTQIHNRSFLLETLDKELQRSIRFRRPFSLLFVDLDHFKHINDRFGHSFGDRVLTHVVQAMRGVLRPADIIGRLGGEEFLIGLVETDGRAARQIAERLRLKVACKPLDVDGTPLSLTISIGLATADNVARIEELIDHADQALYRAKEGGRNQVQVVGE